MGAKCACGVCWLWRGRLSSGVPTSPIHTQAPLCQPLPLQLLLSLHLLLLLLPLPPCQPVAQMSLLTDKPLATSPLTSPKTNRPSLETSETCPCLCIKASLAGSSMLEMWTNDQKVELADSGQGGLQIREFTRSRGFRLQAGSIIISTENPNPSNPNINWLLTRSSQLAYDPYICQASDANIHFQFQYAPRPDLTDTLLFLSFLSEF